MTKRPQPRSNWIILFCIIGLGLLCCAGLVLRGGYLLYTGLSTSSAPRVAASDFLTDLERDDTVDAYAMLCAATRSDTSLEAFADTVHQHRPASTPSS